MAPGSGMSERTRQAGPVSETGEFRYARTSIGLGVDPVVGATGLARRAEGPFLLFERQGGVTVGFGAAQEIVLNAKEIRFRGPDGWHAEPTGAEPLQQIRALLAGSGIEDWRAYGWLAFELSYLLHGMPEAAGDATLAHLVIPRREVSLTEGEADLRALRLDELAELCREISMLSDTPPAPPARDLADEMHGYDDYRGAVEAAVADIQRHRLQKVILSRVVPVPGRVDLPATYLAGRSGNTPARSFLLDLGGLHATGFSPETVVEVSADGGVTTQPLAGTRALSGNPATDADLRDELVNDPKEVYEHAVSVRGAQEELRELCRDGSVRVDEFMVVRRRGSVQHLASRVSGQLDQGRNGWHAMAGLFPAVTASGLPKPEACQAIHRYESQPRGLYGGAVVVCDSTGALDAALVLRTVFEQDGKTWLRAGAGVVGQSVPEREFEETREKLRSISRFLVPEDARLSAGEVAS
ncbi:salicylate synthase [Pseudonocardia eucalypti]|uniref:Salicylate synthase n=2 Tax=Pseudonocardia eucalypti TaxID=648755 RepID=A0ABP9PYV1_9PSEU